MTKSIKFIRTKLEDNATYNESINTHGWGILNNKLIPYIEQSNIPVVSCIGTSRDGKSTLLNLYTNFIMNKTENTSNFFEPFVAVDSDDVGTNGIDYYIIPEKCMLIDCQGMQLTNARYDSHLMLLTYLMSNVIIFTVRQRLDLQVLNNCLPTFSFLCEIPDEYKRKDNDKPILLIRIKDYQGFKQLKTNPNYLEDYVNKWLQKSNDQYDKIKEAFQMAFTIKIMATAPPKMNEHYEFDIHNVNFLQENPTFKSACETIEYLSKNNKTPMILKDPVKLKSLITVLQENKNIDWKKFDFYLQITENEIYKYISDELKQEPYSNTNLTEEMNGSECSYKKYIHFEKQVNEKYNYTFNDKFKDVPSDIKNNLLNPVFDDMYKIIRVCRNINHTKARQMMDHYHSIFINKYKSNQLFQNFLDIHSYFLNKSEEFTNKITNIDMEVRSEYLAEIESECAKIIELQTQITDKNREQHQLIISEINDYCPNNQYYVYIDEQLKDLFAKYIYNVPIDNILNICIDRVKTDIHNIYIKNDKTFHIDTDMNIVHSAGKMTFDITSHLPDITDQKYIDYYWNTKQQYFNKIGMIAYLNQQVDLTINNKIDFVNIHCGNMHCQMTLFNYNTTFFSRYFEKNMLPIYTFVQTNSLNLSHLHIQLNEYCTYSGDGDSNIFTNNMHNDFSICMMKYCTKYKTKYTNISNLQQK